MNQESQPLVSIVVITYNSARFVLETLDSAKEQTYQNIELIISDDGSIDGTVKICSDWLRENKDRFVRSELITVEKNTGIPANCNRGLRKSSGDWVKIIAGDDSLLTDSIEKTITYLIQNENIKVLSTQVEVYRDTFNKKSFLGYLPLEFEKIYSSDTTVNEQIEFIFRGGYHIAPGFFINIQIFDKIGYLDERFRLIEDVPLYLRIGLAGIKIDYYPLRTVKYRKSSLGLTSSNNNCVLPMYMKDYFKSLYIYSTLYGKTEYKVNGFYNFIISRLIFSLGNRGCLLSIINKFRISLQPIRIFNLVNRLKMTF